MEPLNKSRLTAWHSFCLQIFGANGGKSADAFQTPDLIRVSIDEIPHAVLHNDSNQIGVEWLDISTLNLQPLYPSKLRRQIMNFCEGKPYKVYLGNEEAGDPESME